MSVTQTQPMNSSIDLVSGSARICFSLWGPTSGVEYLNNGCSNINVRERSLEESDWGLMHCPEQPEQVNHRVRRGMFAVPILRVRHSQELSLHLK